MPKGVSAPKLTVSNFIASVSPVDAHAVKAAFVSAVQTNPKIIFKYTKPNKSPTTATLVSSRTSLPLCLCENALAKNPDVRKNIASVSALDLSVQTNVNAWDVKMENVIQTTITCTITWELPFMLEGFRLIIYTCFTSLRFDTLNIISFPFSFMIDTLNWLCD
jgi:hypothetical protein